MPFFRVVDVVEGQAVLERLSVTEGEQSVGAYDERFVSIQASVWFYPDLPMRAYA